MTDFLSMTVQQVEGLPETKAQEVLEAWVKAKKAELPQALAQSASKAHVKLAKKALYRLQSSGVEVVTESPKGSAPIIDLTPKNEFPAVLSMQLGTGERAFLFAVPIRGGGGLEVFQGIVSDEFGLAQFGSERANRALYRKRMEQLKTELTTRAMLVPMERLQLELGRAITLNERTKTPYGGEIEQALNSIGVSKKDPDFPIPAMEPGDSENREGGAALHAFPEVEQWLPSEKDLVTLSARVEAIRNGPLPLRDEQKDEKVKKLAHELAAEVFTPELRMLYARRLWYSAEVIEFQKRDADAALARAEARRLAHETTASRFLEQLFVKALPAKK
ncbi:MAG: hypothetical protein Q8K32_08730 [Archangium sp.]|nr:hypothetical protein [Archangium sp.]